MAINYSLAQMKNPQNPDDPKKWYAKAQAAGVSTIDTLADEIAYATSLTDGDVLNVIRALVKQINKNLAAGQIVKLERLGTFQAQISSEGVTDANTFNPVAHVRSVNIQFRPGPKIREAMRVENLTFNVVPRIKDVAKVLKARKSGQTNVDLSDTVEEDEDSGV